MNARVAVATARYGDPWDELSVLAARLAGALACTADVDVLVPVAPNLRSSGVDGGWDGACRVLQFPAAAADRRLRVAWRQIAFGSTAEFSTGSCNCPVSRMDGGRGLPALVEEQLVLAEGGDSPPLYDHLRATPYDVVLFVGLHYPVTCFGVRAVPEGKRVFLVPAGHDLAFGLAVDQLCLARSEQVIVCTESQRRQMVERVGAGGVDRVENLGFLLGINTVVQPLTPSAMQDRFVVVAGDWQKEASRGSLRHWAERLAQLLPGDVKLRLVGPGAAMMPHGVPHSDSRIDAWWWMSRAVAVIDPVPHRVIGQEVLESLLLGVPAIVAADGGASREHAETGNGGLWFRVNDELVGCVVRLLESEIAASLGEQGRSYALSRFADSDTFVKRVTEVVLG